MGGEGGGGGDADSSDDFDPGAFLSTFFIGGGGGGSNNNMFFATTAPFLSGLMAPSALSTAEFPDQPQLLLKAGLRPARKRGRSAAACCCICLDAVCTGNDDSLEFPCGHAFHRRHCAFNLLATPVLGAQSMMRCPMCRACVDRHDLANVLGADAVKPSALCAIAKRCESFRSLTDGTSGALPRQEPIAKAVARCIQRCAAMRASDGFVYNTCLLAIDRALFHRRGFVRVLEGQLRSGSQSPDDVPGFVETSLLCHVEVLMHTGNTPDTDV